MTPPEQSVTKQGFSGQPGLTNSEGGRAAETDAQAVPPAGCGLTDEIVDRAHGAFIVAMQRTGTTREALRAALEATGCWS